MSGSGHRADASPDERLIDAGSETSTAPRLALAVVVTAGTALAVDRMMPSVASQPLLAPLLALLAALATGLILGRRSMAPLHQAHVELRERYVEVVAEALEDPLTHLGNHRAFQEELDRQVAAAERYGDPLSLILLDLDDFKGTNDSEGHAEGDRTLARFGRIVTSTMRRADRGFRVGGDEFAILLPHTDAAGAATLGSRLLSEALQPVRRDAAGKPISFSAGVSSLPDLADGRSQLYSQADAALYASKRAGRTAVSVYEPGAVQVSEDIGAASSAVAEVIAGSQLRPVFQPILDLSSGATIGYEGLIRPVQPAPFANPAELFAAAEASGRLVTLDLRCLEVIIAAARGLSSQHLLSVNLSPRTVESADFGVAALLGILSRHGFPAQQLVVELTEQLPIVEMERVRRKLSSLRAAGIRLAADDVGAGNAGLRLLSEIRFDIIKVDLSLVRRSGPEAPSRAVLASVVELASRTGALVIAEGIEEPAQVAPLLELGVCHGQGFHLGRPAELPGDSLGAPVGGMGEALSSPMRAWRQSIGLSA
jgi:diguanylate cyclase (GGDEF)-like protein